MKGRRDIVLRQESSTAPARDTENRVEHELPKHEKIRFRRDEITDLASSSVGRRPNRSLPGATDWFPKTCWNDRFARSPAASPRWSCSHIVALYAIGLSGIGSERLRVEAEKALEAGRPASMSTPRSDRRASPSTASRFLALEVRDVSLKRMPAARRSPQAGSVRFGVRLLPLLSGDVRGVQRQPLRRAHHGGGHAHRQGSDWTAAFRNEAGSDRSRPRRQGRLRVGPQGAGCDGVEVAAAHRTRQCRTSCFRQAGASASVRVIDCAIWRRPTATAWPSRRRRCRRPRDRRSQAAATRDAATQRISALDLDGLRDRRSDGGATEQAAAGSVRSS